MEPMAGIERLANFLLTCGSSLSLLEFKKLQQFALIALILQGFFCVSSLISVLSHFLSRLPPVSDNSEFVPDLMPVFG